jgi:hypothetical protein
MVFLRAIAVWLLIIFTESLHGTARRFLLEPYLGDFRARQLAVFTGSLIIFTIIFLCIRWLRASSIGQLLGIGLLWVGLTLGFELLLGRLVFDYSWERILSDYNLREGGLMIFGLLFLIVSPYLAAKARRVI